MRGWFVPIKDYLLRPLRDLRISVTDRCNFRCRYCMPAEVFGEGYQFLPKPEILSHEEVARLALVFVNLGVVKLRVTGGEPFLRKGLGELVGMLAEIDGVEDLAMTTNGVMLARYADKMKRSGLHRVTVSLDALDQEVFSKMNGVQARVGSVVEGIDAALSVDLGVKLNCVLKRGANEQEILPLARFARERGVSLRFIEYMDTGNTNGWKAGEVVSWRETLELLEREFSLEKVDHPKLGETAVRYRYVDIPEVEVGFINSVSQPFCQSCNRARLSADGQFYTCLFASQGHDVKSLLREGACDEELRKWICAIWNQRKDRYSELRSLADGDRSKPEMSYIGG